MKRNNWWLFLGALFIVGQLVLVVFKQTAVGVGLSALAVFAGLAGELWHSKRGLPWLMSGAALACAILAQCLVASSGQMGFWLFALSGFLLLAAKPDPGASPVQWEQGVPVKPAPREAWELWFFVGLVLVAWAVRFLHFNGFPFGSIAEEAQHIPVIDGAVANGVYVPHFTHGNMGTPTLLSYLGYAFAKIFGHTINSFRMAPELFGVLSIAVFYFVARRITSPFTAAALALLYATWPLQIGFSRRFYPYIVIFIPVVLGFGMLFIGMAKKHWIWFLMAGLGAGLSLHGYEAGRGVFLIFIFWWLWLALFHRRLLPSRREILWFGLGFVITALPIFYHMAVNWDNYWHYVASKNPNLHQPMKGYLRQVMTLVPQYLQVFHVKSDGNYTMYRTYQPILNPVIGVLFGLGFFFCVSQFWQPVPAFLLAFLAAGIMPALIGGGEEHPTARRMVLAYPAIYLIAAMGLERLRQVWTGTRPWINRGILALIALLALFTAGMDFHHYFYQWGDSPEARAGFCYRAQKMVDDIRKYPGAAIRIQPLLGHEQLWVLGLGDFKAENFPTLEEYLVMDPSQDCLLFLEGYMEAALPFFKKQFPHAAIEIYREAQMDDPFTTTGAFHKLGTDPYFPMNYVIRVFLPKEDIVAFQSLLDISNSAQPKRLPVFSDTFGQQYSGKNLKLAGAVVIKRTGAQIFQLSWPGCSVRVDGRSAAWNAPILLEAGIHYLALNGRVPESAKGMLPLTIMSAQNKMPEHGSFMALQPEMGMRVVGREKQNQWTGPTVMERHELFPFKRYYYDTSVPWTYSNQHTGELVVPETGKYDFETKAYATCRLLVNGKSVFDNFANIASPKKESIQLQAGQPAPFQADFLLSGESLYTTLLVYYRGPKQHELALVPNEWFKLPPEK